MNGDTLLRRASKCLITLFFFGEALENNAWSIGVYDHSMRHPGEMLYALAAWTTLCGTPRSGEITISPPTSTTYGRDLITRSLVNFNLDLPKTCSFTSASRGKSGDRGISPTRACNPL